MKKNLRRLLEIFKKKYQKYPGGNMTLEAAIIVPFIMIIILMTVKSGVNMYSEVKEKSAEYVYSIDESAVDTYKKRKRIYEYRLIKEEVEKLLE